MQYYFYHIVVDEMPCEMPITCLEDLLKNLRKIVMYEALHIEVRRSSVVDDALRAASKRKFDPSKSLKVCHVGIIE